MSNNTTALQEIIKFKNSLKNNQTTFIDFHTWFVLNEKRLIEKESKLMIKFHVECVRSGTEREG